MLEIVNDLLKKKISWKYNKKYKQVLEVGYILIELCEFTKQPLKISLINMHLNWLGDKLVIKINHLNHKLKRARSTIFWNLWQCTKETDIILKSLKISKLGFL